MMSLQWVEEGRDTKGNEGLERNTKRIEDFKKMLAGRYFFLVAFFVRSLLFFFYLRVLVFCPSCPTPCVVDQPGGAVLKSSGVRLEQRCARCAVIERHAIAIVRDEVYFMSPRQ
jgi:hypothetical protein